MNGEYLLFRIVATLLAIPCIGIPLLDARRRGGTPTRQEAASLYFGYALLWAAASLPVLELARTSGSLEYRLAPYLFWATPPACFVLAALAHILQHHRRARRTLLAVCLLLACVFGGAIVWLAVQIFRLELP